MHNKFRKISLLLAIIASMGVLTACNRVTVQLGKDTDVKTESSEANIEKNTTETIVDDTKVDNNKEDEKVAKWETKEMETPSIDAITSTDVQITDGLTIKTYNSFIDLTLNDLESIFLKNTYFRELYPNYNRYTTENMRSKSYSDVGDKYAYTIKNGIWADPEDRSEFSHYMTIDLYRDTTLYNNYSDIYVYICGQEINEELQEHTKTLLLDLTKNDALAEYAVYAKGTDDELSLSATVEAGEASYRILRQIDVDEKKVQFRIDIDEDSIKKSSFEYYDGGYTSTYPYEKFGFQNMLGDNIGNTHIESISTFLGDFFESEEYTITEVRDASLRHKLYPYDTNEYTMDITVAKGLEEVSRIVCPEYKIAYECLTTEDIIVEQELTLECDTEHIMISEGTDEEQTKAFEELFTKIKAEIDLLFPGIDISEATVELLDSGKNINTTYEIDGVTYDFTLSASFGTTFVDSYKGAYTIKLKTADN